MNKFLLCLLPFLTTLQSCSDSNAETPPITNKLSPPSAVSMNYQSIHAPLGFSEGLFNKTTTVTNNQASYEQALADRTTQVPKHIDFEQSSVVFLDMGIRNSGGYRISISSVVEKDDYVLATVMLSLPGENCIVGWILTNPLAIIKIDTTKEILFSEQLQIISC